MGLNKSYVNDFSKAVAVLKDPDLRSDRVFAPPNPSSIARVSKEITKALAWFGEQTFEPGGMLFLAKQEALPAALCLNLILDSYHPILFAAKSMVVTWAQRSREARTISDAAFVRETLMAYPLLPTSTGSAAKLFCR